ncbi:peptidoglycan DD-metalloendopeptidase family protein [Mesorhizobium microcysteis]|uniref:Peptidoglycan DD-metalloendopeptidase family protein n=1 Tax=Neoaquamicrobium microcysteis TaxID=2682781 RepID=A0A5D4GQ64_9HYPH|nr:M23 family metallopeptidase [Mesorhizobium microcysteis]TYR31011.1 peptidoglycan DD-metalloendopeptidase family protein [Mesorhizobium microcysteis]
MRLGVTGKYQRTLARGAAVLLIGGLAAGCSSDVSRFQDSILTGSSRPQQAAPVQQPFPGDVAQVDQTYTGSVASAQRGGGILNRVGLNPRPAGDIGGGTMMASAPTQNTWSAPQPVYNNAPVQGVARSGLSSPVASAPAVQNAQMLPAPSAPGTAQRAPVAPTLADATLPAPGAPTPGQAPERLAVLPQQPKLKEQQPGTQLAANDTQRGAAPAGGSYTVVAGDTLNGIARKTGVNAEALKQANGLSSGLIRIGQTLTIPAGGAAPTVQVAQAPRTDATTTATVAPAKPAQPESVSAYTPPKPQQPAESVIQQASLDTSAPAPDATGISRMRWPVRGRVISGFGGSSGGKKNDGIDIAVPAGTPVRAAENGVVIYAGDGLKEFGNTVLVRHEDGLVTVYGHASEINVQRGQKVRRGEEIAKAGMSGSAETPKLHFEVRKDSTPVNPTTFLE